MSIPPIRVVGVQAWTTVHHLRIVCIVYISDSSRAYYVNWRLKGWTKSMMHVKRAVDVAFLHFDIWIYGSTSYIETSLNG